MTTTRQGWPKVAMATPTTHADRIEEDGVNTKMQVTESKGPIAQEEKGGHPHGGVAMATFGHPCDHPPADGIQGHPGDAVADPMAMFADLALADWLGMVRARGYRLRVDDGRAHLEPGPDQTRAHTVWRDYVMLTRYNHALVIAAAGSHPTWWSYASGKTNQLPAIDDIPVSPADADADAFACATCARPADTINGRAIAWCDDHRPEVAR